MPLVAAICVPLFVFILPILLVLTHVVPGWFGADELWALQQPCTLLLPFSASLWWITLRRLCGRRGGFLMPWVVWLLAAVLVGLYWWSRA